jgi:hypothetical protein
MDGVEGREARPGVARWLAPEPVGFLAPTALGESPPTDPLACFARQHELSALQAICVVGFNPAMDDSGLAEWLGFRDKAALQRRARAIYAADLYTALDIDDVLAIQSILAPRRDSCSWIRPLIVRRVLHLAANILSSPEPSLGALESFRIEIRRGQELQLLRSPPRGRVRDFLQSRPDLDFSTLQGSRVTSPAMAVSSG